MTGEELRAAIRALLTSHPKIKVSKAGHAAHAERYIAEDGVPIGLEPATIRFQNIWVRADSVRPRQLAHLNSRIYEHRNFEKSKPNHNLFGETAFRDSDLICFKITELWQAVQIIAEVVGLS